MRPTPLHRALSIALAIAMLSTGLMALASLPTVSAATYIDTDWESGTDGWNLIGAATRSTEQAHDGTYSLRAQYDGKASKTFAGGQYMYIEFWFRIPETTYFNGPMLESRDPSATGSNIGPMLEASTSSGGSIRVYNDAWSAVTVKTGITADTWHKITIEANWGSGTVQYDEETPISTTFVMDGSPSNYGFIWLGWASNAYEQSLIYYDDIYIGDGPPSVEPSGWAPYFHSLPEEDWVVNTYYTYQPQANESATITAPVLPAWATYNGGLITGIPTSAGDYDFSVKAVSTAGTLTAWQNWTVHVGLGAPNALFSWTVGGPAPNTVTFTPQVFGASEGWSYAWDFGDGGTGTDMAPDHWYTHPGTFTVTLNVSYGAAYDVDTADVEVDPNQLTTSPPTGAVVGMPYSYTLSVLNGTPAFYLTTDAAWLSISNGVISGTPGEEGQYQISIRAEWTTQYSLWQNYTLTVSDIITSSPPASGYIAVPYSYQVTAAVNVTSWSISGAAWLSISSTGLITGTPLTAGPHPVSITAQTGDGPEWQNYTLTVGQAITSTPVTTVIDGQPYEYIVTSAAPVSSWGLSGSTTWLMPGPFNPYEQRIHGTSVIGRAGDYTVRIRATIGGVDVWQNYTLTVIPDAIRAITGEANATAYTNTSYQYQLATPYNVTSWHIDGPEWLSISSTGLITGTPPNGTQGLYHVVVNGTTAGGAFTHEYDLRVYRPPLTLDDMMIMLIGFMAALMVIVLLAGVVTGRRRC